MNRDHRLPTLAELDDWQLANSDQDIRGRPLMMHSGEQLGIVRRMLVDREHERVAALVLDNGRTVSVEDIEIRDGQAYIDAARELPDGVAVPPARAEGEQVIQIVEEELAVGKRAVERGHIRVRSRIVETPVHDEVRLREEHVNVERRPVDRPVRDADRALEDRTVEMTETDEEAVVGKRARVVEEVVVRKDVEDRVEQIDDTVRRTEVDIERNDDSDRAGTDRLAAKGSTDKLA